MKRRKQVLVVSLLILMFLCPLPQLLAQDGLHIEVELENYDGKEVYLAYYFGKSQYIRDTAQLEDGKYVFSADTLVDPGVYMVVLPPDNRFFQVLLPGDDQQMTCKGDAEDLGHSVAVSGSSENSLFIDYLQFLKVKRAEKDTLLARIGRATAESEKAPLQDQLEALDAEVDLYQEDLVQQNPASITALLVNANTEIDVPEFEGSKSETELQRYYYYRTHYFDHLDFHHPAIARTPFLFPRIEEYITKLTVQHPDSIIQAVDHVLGRFEPGSEGFRYYLIHFLNEFAASKIVGFDAIYVHLAENYYGEGLAPWTDEEQLQKILKNARTIKPLLIGRPAPDLQFEHRDGTPLRISDVDAEYTVLFFWDPECGHCKKSIPRVVDFQDQFKERGVVILAICTSLRDEVKDCWEAVEERNMDSFINVADPWLKSRFKQIYDIRSTPQIYILDRDKKIIMKKIGAEQLPEVMEKLMEIDRENKS